MVIGKVTQKMLWVGQGERPVMTSQDDLTFHFWYLLWERVPQSYLLTVYQASSYINVLVCGNHFLFQGLSFLCSTAFSVALLMSKVSREILQKETDHLPSDRSWTRSFLNSSVRKPVTHYQPSGQTSPPTCRE